MVFIPTAFAQAPKSAPEALKRASEPSISISNPTEASLKSLAIKVAKEHALNVNHFVNTIECESHFNPQATGDYPDGHGNFVTKDKAPNWSHPTSFGIAQLHNPVKNWGLTIKQAETPSIALETMAKAWDNNHANYWSCFRLLGYGK